MSSFPKLRVKTFPGAEEELRDFEQGKDLPFQDVLIFVEGKRVNSFEELEQMLAEDSYRQMQSLEVMVLSAGLFDGG
jgi:hypothetical protein